VLYSVHVSRCLGSRVSEQSRIRKSHSSLLNTFVCVFALIAAGRRRAADMLARLNDEQRRARSLCSEWTVRDVAAHLIGPFRVSVPKFVAGRNPGGQLRSDPVQATRRARLARTPAAAR